MAEPKHELLGNLGYSWDTKPCLDLLCAGAVLAVVNKTLITSLKTLLTLASRTLL